MPVDMVSKGYSPIVDRLLPGAAPAGVLVIKPRQMTRTGGLEVFELFPNWEGLGLWFALDAVGATRRPLAYLSAETQEIDGLPLSRSLNWDIRESLQVLAADALVTHSDAHRQRMAVELSIDPETILVIPHGISCVPISSGTAESAERSVVFLGRLAKREGALDLLNAIPLVLAIAPHTRFILIGRDRAHLPGGRTHQEYISDELPPHVAADNLYRHLG